MFVFDVGYDPIAITDDLADTRAQALVRISSKRVFYPEPPPRPEGRRGRPRLHGERFALLEPDTATAPGAELTGTDRRYGNISVKALHHLHPKLPHRGRWANHHEAPFIAGSVIRVDVEHLPKPAGRANKTLWLRWSGPGAPDLDICWRAYLRRFDIEHTFRFVKSILGWTTPALCTPDQADRWTWLIVAAYTNCASPAVSSRIYACHGNAPRSRQAHPRQSQSPKRIPVAACHHRHPRPATKIPKTRSPPPQRHLQATSKPPRTRHPAIKKAT